MINWRTIWTPLAPSATRTANSRDRAAERASSKFATFAQAINNTSPTAPSNSSSVPPTSPTMNPCSGPI
jgi:hypothetical protein